MSAVLDIVANVGIRRETFAELEPDIHPLLIEHWREIALYQDAVALEPDFARYEKAEQAGSLVMLAARRAGALVGYSVFLLHWHIHYKSCRMASNDVLYVTPAERKTGTGIRLIRESERELVKAGAHRITWHIKPLNDFSAILKRMGYQHEETVMGRMLGGSNGH